MTTARPVRRLLTDRKAIVAPIGVSATVLACLAVGLPAAQANDGGAQGTDDVFGAWAWSRFTEPQSEPNPPADPDGQAGEDNLANVLQIGEGYDTWVPGTATVKSTGWLASRPAGEGWTQIDEKVVPDSPAIPATADSWTDQVWHVYAGNNNSDTQPELDDPRWNATGGNPHSANHAFENHTPNVPYAVDKANGHGSDWFLWTATFVPGNPGQEAVTHKEFRYERQVTTPGYTEYYWSVYERTNTPGHPVVEEPSEPEQPTQPEQPIQPEQPAEPNEPSVPDEPKVKDVQAVKDVHEAAPGRDDSTQSKHAQADRRAVPLSIDAGL